MLYGRRVAAFAWGPSSDPGITLSGDWPAVLPLPKGKGRIRGNHLHRRILEGLQALADGVCFWGAYGRDFEILVKVFDGVVIALLLCGDFPKAKIDRVRRLGQEAFKKFIVLLRAFEPAAAKLSDGAINQRHGVLRLKFQGAIQKRDGVVELQQFHAQRGVVNEHVYVLRLQLQFAVEQVDGFGMAAVNPVNLSERAVGRRAQRVFLYGLVE